MARNLAATIRDGAPVFAALGDPIRLRILARLSTGGPLSIAQLTDGETVTRQAITKHLETLAAAGLVRDLREGRERRFEVELAPLASARTFLDQVSATWDRRLLRLKALVED